jgi:hypothetical protein
MVISARYSEETAVIPERNPEARLMISEQQQQQLAAAAGTTGGLDLSSSCI